MKTTTERRRLSPASLTAWCLPLAAWGCSEDVESPPAPGYAVTDSAGVRKVVNNEPLWGAEEGWQLTPEPLLTLGVVDTPFAQQFHEIRGVTRLSDSTIVVLNSGSAELRAFDYSGRHLWSAGGRGDGPGEMGRQQDQRPLLQRLAGDTLEVDNGWQRIRFGPGGELLDHRRLDFARLHQEVGRYYVGSCPQGRSYFKELIVVCPTGDGSPQPGRRWESSQTTVMQIPWTLDRVDTVGTFFRHEKWETSVPLPLPPPLRSERTSLRPAPLGPKGRLWIGGSPQPRLLYARNDAYRIEVWDLLDATLSMVVERRTPRKARTEAEIFVAVWLGLLQQREPDPSELSLTNGRQPVVDSLSIAESFFLDDLGFMWVRRLPVGDDEGRRWEVGAAPDFEPSGWVVSLPSGLHDVFRPDGVYLGTVKLPPAFDVMEIGTDYVLGIARDEMGVEYVHLYGLERGGSPWLSLAGRSPRRPPQHGAVALRRGG